MSAIKGPNVIKSGLILALDAANARSFKGPPQTNLLTGINYSISNTDTATFKVTNGTLNVNVPKRGQRNVKYVDIFNDYNGGSGQCCPNLFNFGDITVSGNTAYTYSIVYKTTTGYTHPNYMYRYEYNGGTYVTEAGVHSTGNRTDLGDGWYHAWGTFTTQANTNRLITYLFHYEYATHNRVLVESIQITQGSYIGEPEHMLEPSQVRGTTFGTGGGLGDLIGNNHGGLVNSPTFNSSNLGNISFDGVDDHITMGTAADFATFTSGFTINLWVYPTSTAKFCAIFSSAWGTSGTQWQVYVWYNTSSQFGTTQRYSGTQNDFNTSNIFPINNWYNVVVTSNNTTCFIYVNGISQVSNGTGQINNQDAAREVRLGNFKNYSGAEYTGRIATCKVYNRALSAAEVLQNYNATKKRFGL
jgi:hypothetical protein